MADAKEYCVKIYWNGIWATSPTDAEEQAIEQLQQTNPRDWAMEAEEV